MITVDAFLLDGDCVALSIEEVEQILSHCYCSWLEVGCPHPLELPTVHPGTFHGFINSNRAPIGHFITDEGEIYKINEDNAERIA